MEINIRKRSPDTGERARERERNGGGVEKIKIFVTASCWSVALWSLEWEIYSPPTLLFFDRRAKDLQQLQQAFNYQRKITLNVKLMFYFCNQIIITMKQTTRFINIHLICK